MVRRGTPHGLATGSSGASAARIAGVGLAALAVAMGIGRFAFTPILPMMLAHAEVDLAAAGWLAAANYFGYLVGALCAARLPLRWAVRGGLLAVAAATFAMGLTQDFPLWLLLRFTAGVASAWILVHVSAWALESLSRIGRQDANGAVFAGVGVGIAGAGLVCMALMAARVSPAHAWEWFGLISAALCAAVWPAFRATTPPAVTATERTPRRHWTVDRVRLAVCYGAFGFGYIVPATFLPAMAHHYIANPAVFGWAWPVFGAAAAASTWAVSRWLHVANNRRVWATAYLLMAVGIALPVVWPGLPAVLIAALMVGGTFMVATMLGLREARRVAGADATGLIAALTAAFALMQVVGPLLVSALAKVPHGFSATLLVATLALSVSAGVLWRSAGVVAAQTQLDG